MEIHSQLAQVLVKLDGVSALSDSQIKQELRIRALEIDFAAHKATTTQRNDTWTYVFMGLMTISQLALTFYNAVLK